MNVNKLTLTSVDFPFMLKELAKPPQELFILGNLGPLLERPRLAVVGSRKVSAYGRQATMRLTQEVASHGVVIVSGLALGVDGIAHRAAIEAGGQTIAVLPCGIDKIYPASHHQLARDILSRGGAIISEYPPGTEPFRTNFIARNRIVSGISDGLLITEAAAKSGTLHTANFALDQGRMVMAVPGNINSFLSVGTNNLIKAGAVPVTEANDILLALDLPTAQTETAITGANREETLILELISSGITEANELLSKSMLSPALFNQTLTMLELGGRIRPLGAGHWCMV